MDPADEEQMRLERAYAERRADDIDSFRNYLDRLDESECKRKKSMPGSSIGRSELNEHFIETSRNFVLRFLRANATDDKAWELGQRRLPPASRAGLADIGTYLSGPCT